jgi:transcriptional regulator with XRE-family HTH domain
MASRSDLGDFLRTRRERLHPADVGLPGSARRRVPGLRREEAALLAGISPEYYLRLEQGRVTHPSTQVVDALATALRLEPDARTHLHRLARQPEPLHRAPPAAETVQEGVLLLLDAIGLPAFVLGRFLDVLASNSLARTLTPTFTPGVNTLRSAFLDPAGLDLYADRADVVEDSVAGLRALAGSDMQQPSIVELIGDLEAQSDTFRSLWARHDVRAKVGGSRRMVHPVVGELELLFEKLAVTGAPDQLLVVYHARPNTPSEAALSRLIQLDRDSPAGDGLPA